jgi:hypothetical protein
MHACAAWPVSRGRPRHACIHAWLGMSWPNSSLTYPVVTRWHRLSFSAARLLQKEIRIDGFGVQAAGMMWFETSPAPPNTV